jgi:spoIIIJ-associated protein
VEWVETRAKSVAEAIELALDQLGVDETELEYEVVEEPKAGLFGRVRGEAAIRARVKPTQRSSEKKGRGAKAAGTTKEAPARAEKAVAKSTSAAGPAKGKAADKTEPASKRRPAASAQAKAAVAAVADEKPKEPRSARPPRRPPVERTERNGDDAVDLSAVAASGIRFLEGFVEAAHLEATVSSRTIDEQTLELEVTGPSLGVLVGPKGQTLLALQELVRTYVHHDTGGRSGRLMLDVAGYRQKRRVALEAFTRQVVETVISSGERRALEPMNAVDRKVVHDTANDIDGVRSISEGEDPNRYVVLLPE